MSLLEMLEHELATISSRVGMVGGSATMGAKASLSRVSRASALTNSTSAPVSWVLEGIRSKPGTSVWRNTSRAGVFSMSI